MQPPTTLPLPPPLRHLPRALPPPSQPMCRWRVLLVACHGQSRPPPQCGAHLFPDRHEGCVPDQQRPNA